MLLVDQLYVNWLPPHVEDLSYTPCPMRDLSPWTLALKPHTSNNDTCPSQSEHACRTRAFSLENQTHARNDAETHTHASSLTISIVAFARVFGTFASR